MYGIVAVGVGLGPGVREGALGVRVFLGAGVPVGRRAAPGTGTGVGASTCGAQLLKSMAPMPPPASFKKSRRDNIGLILSGIAL